MLRYLPYLVLIALWIYALVDCLGTPEREVRWLPKVVWVLVILFFGEILVGPIAWLLAGKRRVAVAYPRSAYGLPNGGPGPDGDMPPGGGAPAGGPHGAEQVHDGQAGRRREWTAPDDNPEFLRSLSERIKQRREDGTAPSDDE